MKVGKWTTEYLNDAARNFITSIFFQISHDILWLLKPAFDNSPSANHQFYISKCIFCSFSIN